MNIKVSFKSVYNVGDIITTKWQDKYGNYKIGEYKIIRLRKEGSPVIVNMNYGGSLYYLNSLINDMHHTIISVHSEEENQEIENNI